MKINHSNTYKRDLSKLKIDFALITKSIDLFKENEQHPSLHNKNIKCKRAANLYNIRVNKQYRILYFKYRASLKTLTNSELYQEVRLCKTFFES